MGPGSEPPRDAWARRAPGSAGVARHDDDRGAYTSPAYGRVAEHPVDRRAYVVGLQRFARPRG
eukprot:9595261-Alexandrium_andersonii.AAC.1